MRFGRLGGLGELGTLGGGPRRASSSVGLSVNPTWANVVINLPLTSDLTDTKGNTFTATGTAAVSGGYLTLDGNSSIFTAAKAAFAATSGDFTLRMVINFTSLTANQYFYDFSNNLSRIQLTGGATRSFGESAEFGSGAAWSPSTATDYFIVNTRSGGVVTLAWGIATPGSATTTLSGSSGASSQNFGNASSAFNIGNYGGGGAFGINGKVKHFQYAVGAACDPSRVPSFPYPTS